MFKLVVCLSILAIVAAQGPLAYLGRGLEEGYKPYNYGYTTVDEFGTTTSREETADGNGNVRGSYAYREANGIGRRVEYIVDPVNGFRVVVDTNEPGTISSSPAAAQIRSVQ